MNAMSPSTAKTVKQWRVVGYDGFDSLEFSEGPVQEFGDNEVLVKSEFTNDDDLTKKC